jgi:hypothetical protein
MAVREDRRMPGTMFTPARGILPAGFAHRLRPWVGRLQAAVALYALLFSFRAHRLWYAVALFFALPLLRAVVSAPFRRAAAVRLAGLWRELENYPAAGRTPWRAVLVFVIAPVVSLTALGPCLPCSGDTAPVMLEATALLHHGSLELSEYLTAYSLAYATGGEGPPYFLARTRNGRVYSAYPSGMVPFALPVAGMSRILGAEPDRPMVRERLQKWAACWVAAGCLGLFFLLALHRVGPAPAWVMTALLATGSVMYSTVGQALWQHGGVILGSLAVLLLEFRQARRASVPATLGQGVACAFLIACRLSSGLFVMALGLWVLARAPRRAVLLGAAAAVALAPWAWLYWSMYGTPIGPSTGQMEPSFWKPNLLLSGLLGVLVSPSRGLLVYQPWLLLAGALVLPSVFRCLPAGRAPAPAGWAVFCGAAVILHLGLISSWGCWCGGYCWGSRLASEAVPLCALLLLRPLAALWSTPGGRFLVIAVGVVAFLLHVPADFLHSDRWNPVVLRVDNPDALWSWSDAPFLFPFLHGGS